MNIRHAPRTLFVLALGLFLSLSSCGPRAVAYGVILWGEPTGPAGSGALVSILRETPVDGSVPITIPGGGNPRDFPVGRLRVFDVREDAVKFAADYATYLTTWALSQKLDPPPLPIRDMAKAEGKSVYRLRPNQLVKVISKTAQKETVGSFQDYWYEVVTEDGYSGWCYGHYLKVFVAEGDPGAQAQTLMSQDESLEAIMGSTWRPDWFAGMIDTGRIDLSSFREDIGFFPMPSEGFFKLVLPSYSLEFHYTSVDRMAAGLYQASGTDLKITLLDKTRITISYRYKSQEVNALYVVLDNDVAEIIKAEQELRQGFFDAVRAGGSTLTSSAYGSIKLMDGMRFSWSGFDPLVPSVIARGAQGTGTVDFPYRISRALQGSYDGAITFLFDGLSAPSRSSSGPGTSGYPGVSFLYKVGDGGLRLTSIAKESITELAVTKAGFSPVIIFFTQGP